MSRTLYVAGSSDEAERAASFMRGARALGWQVTVDWTEALREAQKRGIPANVMPDEAAQDFALADLIGVRTADVVVLLCPRGGSPARGAYVELGYAMALEKLTVVVRDAACPSIFHSLACAQVDSDEEGLAWLARPEHR